MSETSDKSRRTRFNLKDIGCNEPFKDRGMPDLTGKLLVSLHEQEEGALGANLSTQRLRKQGARVAQGHSWPPGVVDVARRLLA